VCGLNALSSSVHSMNPDDLTASSLGRGPLASGTRVGSYRIESPLGEGGMGTVYRAHDAKLNRPVAIKFLSDRVADASGRRRFQREAQMASSLNHPHILTVHDVGEFGERQYLVTEFIEGGTLKDWIRQEKRTWRQIVELLTGVADGLAAAHGAGILHRDIKPANIFVGRNGYAKLADFGLARLAANQPHSDETNTSTAEETRVGDIIGTIAYMSPEQASGRSLDARSDIFSFGVVLYELLSGRRPFDGASDLEVLQKVIHGTPEPLSADVPIALRMVVEKALEKDPAERYQTTRDLVVDLRRLAHHRASESAPAAQDKRRRSGIGIWIVAAASILLALGASYWFSLRSGGEPSNAFADAAFTKFTNFPGDEISAAISPDGKFVVFASDRDGPMALWVGQVGTNQFRNITQGKYSIQRLTINPTSGFTPDGSEVVIFQGALSQNFLTPFLGGPVRPFLKPKENGFNWSQDGTRLVYLFAENGDPLFVSEADGANPRQIFQSRPGEHNHFPTWSPDGRWIYFVHGIVDTEEWDLWRVPAAGGQAERLTEFNRYLGFPTPLDSRTVVYVGKDQDGSGPWLWALDVETRSARRAIPGLERYTSIAASSPATDGSRRLVASVANPVAQLWSVPVQDNTAEESDVKPYPVPSVRVLAPRFGGESVFYLSSSGGNDGLWRFDAGQSQSVELWKGSGGPLFEPPAVSPDGQKAAIVLRRSGKQRLRVLAADGSDLGLLTEVIDVRGSASWSPDGKWVVIGGNDGKGDGLFKIPADGGAPERLVSGFASNPVWSPDGMLIVYSAQQLAGAAPIRAVRPDGSAVDLPAIQVAPGGERFRFLPNGSGLVFMPGRIGNTRDFGLLDLKAKTTRPLTRLNNTATIRTFDVTPDGKQIVFDRLRDNSDLVLIDLPKLR
jgi:serine/threonine protein kinase